MRVRDILPRGAGALTVLRLALVGGQFAAMLALAAVLGLARYGEVVALWALALILSGAISVAGPVLILRHLGSGTLRPGALAGWIAGWPAVVALALWPVVEWIAPGIGGAVLLVALGVQAVQAVASVLRVTGSLGGSMLLRDGWPTACLCLAAAAFPAPLLPLAGLLFCGAGIGLLRAAAGGRLAARLSADGRGGGIDAVQWASGLAGMAVAQVDIVIAARLLPPDLAGLYALTRRVANLAALPVSVATWMTAPGLAEAGARGDAPRLARLSHDTCRAALAPALALALALAGLALLLPRGLTDLSPDVPAFLLLLALALVQAGFAAGLSVASLCGAAGAAALSRGVTVAVYLALALGGGLAGSLAGNAAATLAGGVSGAIWLRAVLLRRYGVETSALVLWRRRRGAWA